MGCIGTRSAACYKTFAQYSEMCFYTQKRKYEIMYYYLHLLPANPCGKVTLQIHRSN